MDATISTLTLELAEPFKIVVENNLGTITPYILLEQETWFEREVPFFHAFLKPGMRVVDIGTNCGFYTLLAAHKIGGTGHVWGFEPGAKPACMLRQSLALNNFDNVTLHEAAIGSEPGSAWFLDKASSELSAVVTADTPGARAVRVESLDHLYAKGEMHDIDFVKIDAEGFENQVIEGGETFFTAENPLIMLEIVADQVADTRPTDRLRSLGYETYRYYSGTGCLAPLITDKPGDYILNIFLCKPGREAALREAGLLVTGEALAHEYPAADPALFTAYFAKLPITHSCPKLARLAGVTVLPENLDFSVMCAEFLLSQDPRLDAAERMTRLIRAERWIDLNFINDRSFAQALSFLPVWIACNRVALASGMLKILLGGESGIQATIGEPFLPASAKWQATPAWDGDLNIWLNCMMADQYEFFRTYSSYYDNDVTYETYRLLRNSGYLDEKLERRAGLSALVRDTGFFDALFVNQPKGRNRAIWKEIVTRLTNGQRRICQLDAGQTLSLVPRS